MQIVVTPGTLIPRRGARRYACTIASARPLEPDMASIIAHLLTAVEERLPEVRKAFPTLPNFVWWEVRPGRKNRLRNRGDFVREVADPSLVPPLALVEIVSCFDGQVQEQSIVFHCTTDRGIMSIAFSEEELMPSQRALSSDSPTKDESEHAHTVDT